MKKILFISFISFIFLIPFSAHPCEILKGKVVGVKDGDTITVLVKKKEVPVRLQGVDAPEKNQAFGQRAKQFTSDKVFGKRVKVLVERKGRNGRSIGKVFIKGVSLNEELVAAGFAWVKGSTK